MEKARSEAFSITRQAKDEADNILKELRSMEMEMASKEKNKKIEDIMLVNVESLAFPEGGIGSDMRIATKHVCYLNNEVFDESTGRLEHIPVEGRIGICDGTEGACRSWPCTEVWL